MQDSQFKGYLLEEVISHLLISNGYNIKGVVGVDQGVVSGNAGPNLSGRGGNHQFDTLGEFKWRPPLSYPIRLFVEAKYRKKEVNIQVIRAGIGLLLDINTNLITMDVDNYSLTEQKYNYEYAIFSLTGFTDPAIRLALAHKIHCITLEPSEFSGLIDLIERYVSDIVRTLGNVENNAIPSSVTKDYRKHFRKALESTFESNSNILENYMNENEIEMSETLFSVKEEFMKIPPLFLASANTPFTIGVQPINMNEYQKFMNKIEEGSSHKVIIYWHTSDLKWYIRDAGGEYTLKFTIPKYLNNYIKPLELDAQDRAWIVKGDRLNKISLFVEDVDGSPRFIDLEYDREETEKFIENLNKEE